MQRFVETAEMKTIDRMITDSTKVSDRSPTSESEAIDLFHRRVQIDRDFHFANVSSLKNDFLTDVYKRTEVTLLLARLQLPLQITRRGEAFSEHLEILNHIKAGDSEKATETLITHLENARYRSTGITSNKMSKQTN